MEVSTGAVASAFLTVVCLFVVVLFSGCSKLSPLWKLFKEFLSAYLFNLQLIWGIFHLLTLEEFSNKYLTQPHPSLHSKALCGLNMLPGLCFLLNSLLSPPGAAARRSHSAGGHPEAGPAFLHFLTFFSSVEVSSHSLSFLQLLMEGALGFPEDGRFSKHPLELPETTLHSSNGF